MFKSILLRVGLVLGKFIGEKVTIEDEEHQADVAMISGRASAKVNDAGEVTMFRVPVVYKPDDQQVLKRLIDLSTSQEVIEVTAGEIVLPCRLAHNPKGREYPNPRTGFQEKLRTDMFTLLFSTQSDDVDDILATVLEQANN